MWHKHGRLIFEPKLVSGFAAVLEIVNHSCVVTLPDSEPEVCWVAQHTCQIKILNRMPPMVAFIVMFMFFFAMLVNKALIL